MHKPPTRSETAVSCECRVSVLKVDRNHRRSLTIGAQQKVTNKKITNSVELLGQLTQTKLKNSLLIQTKVSASQDDGGVRECGHGRRGKRRGERGDEMNTATKAHLVRCFR